MTDHGSVGEGVVISRVISAGRDRVFDHWTAPEQLRRWWGPGGFTCTDATIDLRPGGTYRLVMQPPGDSPLMSITGTYLEVVPPALLVYTWRWDSGPAASESESLVTVNFDDLGEGRTEVTVTHDRFPSDHDRSPYRSGWDEGLKKLESTFKGEMNA